MINMDLTRLFAMQKELDTRIKTEHGLQSTTLIDKKIVALLVELGELANETRCFKFWSHKPPASDTVIIEEYVDVLHFILSIGIEIDAESEPILDLTKPLEDVTEQFLKLYEAVIAFKNSKELKEYHSIFTLFLGLGKLLGFSEQKIKEAYISKNEVNHKRQDQGY